MPFIFKISSSAKLPTSHNHGVLQKLSNYRLKFSDCNNRILNISFTFMAVGVSIMILWSIHFNALNSVHAVTARFSTLLTAWYPVYKRLCICSGGCHCLPTTPITHNYNSSISPHCFLKFWLSETSVYKHISN